MLVAVHIFRQPQEGERGVSQMLTIADKGGCGSEKFQQRDFIWTKMWIKRAIDLGFTIHVKGGVA